MYWSLYGYRPGCRHIDYRHSMKLLLQCNTTPRTLCLYDAHLRKACLRLIKGADPIRGTDSRVSPELSDGQVSLSSTTYEDSHLNSHKPVSLQTQSSIKHWNEYHLLHLHLPTYSLGTSDHHKRPEAFQALHGDHVRIQISKLICK